MKALTVCCVLATVAPLAGTVGAQEMPPVTDRWWFDAESLWWSTSDALQPTPLATSGSLSAALPGALGQPGTSVEIGGASVSLPVQAGGRFALGGRIDRESGLAVEVGGFFLAAAHDRRAISTTGLPGSASYTVPLYDVSGYTSGGAPGETLYVLPGPFPSGPGFTGRMERFMSSRMAGAEISGVIPVHQSRSFRVEALAGYRWLSFDEDLSFDVQTSGVIGSSNEGQYFNSRDEFRTSNTFNGAQIGIRARFEFDRIVTQATVKGALGDMGRRLAIDGASSTSAGTIFFPVSGGAGNQLGGGIFAQPSNIGTYDSHRLAGVVEGGIRVGYRLTDWISPYIAYNALYAGSVLRPGDAISHSINTTHTALAAASRGSGHASPTGGAASPTAEPESTTIWTQGFSFGVTARF